MYVLSMSTQSAHSCQKTAEIEPVGSTSVADDLFILPDCTFTIFDQETDLTVAFKFTNSWGLVFFKVSIVTMCVSRDAIHWNGSGSTDGVIAVLFFMTVLLNLSLYSNLIFIGDLLFIGFQRGPVFSGEKQIAFTILLCVCNWQVMYLDDPEFTSCVTPCT